MTGDYDSGLENESDSSGAHLLFSEIVTTNGTWPWTLQVSHAGLVTLPVPAAFTVVPGRKRTRVGSSLEAFVLCHSLRLGCTQRCPSQLAERKPFVYFPSRLADTLLQPGGSASGEL